MAFGITMRPPPEVSEWVRVFSKQIGALATSSRLWAISGGNGRMDLSAGATIRDASNGMGVSSASTGSPVVCSLIVSGWE